MCACLAVSVFPGVSILVPQLASRVTLAVRADARDVIYLSIYLLLTVHTVHTVTVCIAHPQGPGASSGGGTAAPRGGVTAPARPRPPAAPASAAPRRVRPLRRLPRGPWRSCCRARPTPSGCATRCRACARPTSRSAVPRACNTRRPSEPCCSLIVGVRLQGVPVGEKWAATQYLVSKAVSPAAPMRSRTRFARSSTTADRSVHWQAPMLDILRACIQESTPQG